MRKGDVGRLAALLVAAREKLAGAGLLDGGLAAEFVAAAGILQDRSDSLEVEARRVEVAVATLTDGTTCRACNHLCKLYPRIITQSWVRDLERLYRLTVLSPHATASPVGFLHRGVFMEETGAGGDFAKWRYWGFVEEEPNADPAKGRSGWWRIRPLGVRFLTDPSFRVHTTCYVYQSEFVRWKDDSPLVNAQEASRNTFHFGDMMATPVV